MTLPPDDDARALKKLGYAQELARCLGGFSNFAISLSIICILAGGLTSFQVGFSAVGGAAIGIGWPAMGLLSLAVAATMGQVASAFPTAGGLYHWSAVLGGRGWGWATGWFNLAGLVTVLAAINVGTFRFAAGSLDPNFKSDDPDTLQLQFFVVGLMTASQALFNHLGIRVTRILTDFSGWLILIASAVFVVVLLAGATSFEPGRLVRFENFSGAPGGDVWPATESIAWLFCLGLLLPAYTVTGFDASAHAAEETVNAAVVVPRGIVRSVLVSGLAGWVLLSAIVLAMPDPAAAAATPDRAVVSTLFAATSRPIAITLIAAAVFAQYLCGLATVTSASRMAFAFARDGGLPFPKIARRVSPKFQTPSVAIWGVALASVAFTAYTPMYSTIAAVCVILLYVSYVLPTALGFVAYGHRWTHFGPWQLGIWYRPLAVVSVVGCIGLIVIGMQPPNEKALYVVGGMVAVLLAGWFGYARRKFPGPPPGLLASLAEVKS